MEGRATDDLMARLMATFGAEAEEHVEAMNRALLLLRGNTDAAGIQKLLEPLLREAHSLKGAAHAAGAKRVEAVAGRLEDVFDRLHKGELNPDAAVWDVLRSGLDAARALAREATAGEPSGVDTVAIEAMLDHPGRGDIEPPAEQPEQLPASPVDIAISKLEALRSAIDEIHDLLLASATGEQPVDERPDPGGTPKVVLLVEDSQTTRVLQKHLLENAGYEVRTAGDGNEAWNVLQAGGVDVVISDIRMSSMDGFELTARIRADAGLRTLPVILITSTETPERRKRSTEVGADAYVLKGSTEHQNLAKTIERLT